MKDFDKLSIPQQEAISTLISAMTTNPHASVTYILSDVINTSISKSQKRNYKSYTNNELAFACDKYTKLRSAQIWPKCNLDNSSEKHT
jgi:hypothetical protein